MELHGSIYNYNNSYFYPRNCAILLGSATKAIGRPEYNPTDEKYVISVLSEEEMPELLSVIGTSYFVEDTEGINIQYYHGKQK